MMKLRRDCWAGHIGMKEGREKAKKGEGTKEGREEGRNAYKISAENHREVIRVAYEMTRRIGSTLK
jgi:hypothetical protein